MKNKIKKFLSKIPVTFTHQYKRLIMGVGWYNDEGWGLIEWDIFSFLKSHSFTIIHVKILKFCFSILIDFRED